MVDALEESDGGGDSGSGHRDDSAYKQQRHVVVLCVLCFVL